MSEFDHWEEQRDIGSVLRLEEAMERYTDEVFTRTAERLASKSRHRRKPSA